MFEVYRKILSFSFFFSWKIAYFSSVIRESLNDLPHRWRPDVVSVVIVRTIVIQTRCANYEFYLRSQLMPPPLSRDHPLVIVWPPHSYSDLFEFTVCRIDRLFVATRNIPTQHRAMFHFRSVLFQLTTVALHPTNFHVVIINTNSPSGEFTAKRINPFLLRLNRG